MQIKLQDGEHEECNVENMWNNFKEYALTSAGEVLGEKIPYRGNKRRTPWWGEEVKHSVRLKMELFRKWMKSRSAEDRRSYEIARSAAQRVTRGAKEETCRKIGEDLKSDFGGTRKLLYSLANGYRRKRQFVSHVIKDKNEVLPTDSEQISERWKENFCDLLNVPNTQDNPEEENDFRIGEEEEENPITMEELEKTISRMKNGKSPGDDGLPVEVLKAGGATVANKLLKIFNAAYKAKMVPSDWQKGVISAILKKGDKTVCNNHRGITLLSHAGKIYNRILGRRLRDCVEDILDDSQFGFRPGRSTTEAVFTVKMMLEKCWEWGVDKYALFIDLEKAFDRVNRSLLWRILQEDHYNVPAKLVRVIRSIYSQCVSKVRTQKVESAEFSIESGVRQGDVLSPLLFIIFMDKCIRDVKIGENGEETLLYADDVVVMANSKTNIQDVANGWWHAMNENGMKINTQKGKTEVLVISRNSRHTCDVLTGQDKANQVANYTYLGVNVGETNVQELEINNRIAKYNSNVGLMYPLFRDINIPRECKVTIYHTILKPILLYGSEAWSLTRRTESKLQAAEMRVLRTIKGVTRKDRIRNTTIRAEFHVPPLLEEIERNRLR